MTIKSIAFQNEGTIPRIYTCDGENISPPLEIDDIPGEAKNVTLIVEDIDSKGGSFIHWTVWNIDPRLRQIAEGVVPTNAVEGMTDFGKTNYGGPCPLAGEHRYFFRAYALSKLLNIAPASNVEQLKKAMSGNVLVRAELMGRYKRIPHSL